MASKRYLCINCDEAEPGTFKDRLLVDYDPHLVLEGIAIACWACDIDVAYFFIRGEYHHQAKVMEQAIQEAYEHGIFGGKGFMNGAVDHVVECHLHRSAGAYICGEETGLLEAVEGKRGWPRIKPPFPAVKGVFGRPTIVNNVETLACVGPIIEHGAEWWKSHGCESTIGGSPSYGPKLMGVSGHVNSTRCLRMRSRDPPAGADRKRQVLQGHARRKALQGRDRGRRLDGRSGSRSVSTPRWISTSAPSTTSSASEPRVRPSSTKTPTWSPWPATSPASSRMNPVVSARRVVKVRTGC